ncbi:BgTH12-04927 [Blumeria graminis f. sp. triticale]|uniref:BgTH12-04927 n=1 Tax=Blumeria graminis f. sp. triticale TaxID=1689686 RepID=A0A9W4DIE4_BLUGR|nr:BgTH12-04927 [Blumeria graminis f. sp. triticale]
MHRWRCQMLRKPRQIFYKSCRHFHYSELIVLALTCETTSPQNILAMDFHLSTSEKNPMVGYSIQRKVLTMSLFFGKLQPMQHIMQKDVQMVVSRKGSERLYVDKLGLRSLSQSEEMSLINFMKYSISL